MNKSIMRVFSILLCSICVFYCTSCDSSFWDGTESAKSESVTITQLNQPFEGNCIKITADETQIMYDPSEDETLLGIKFTIENISNENYRFRIGTVSAFLDNAAIINDHINSFQPSLKSMSLSPGKYLSGYYVIPIKTDSKKIEIYFEENSVNTVIFQFDIPPIEESTTVS